MICWLPDKSSGGASKYSPGLDAISMMSPSRAAVKAALTGGYCGEGTVRMAADALRDKNAKPTAPMKLPTPDQGRLPLTVLCSFIALLITLLILCEVKQHLRQCNPAFNRAPLRGDWRARGRSHNPQFGMLVHNSNLARNAQTRSRGRSEYGVSELRR